MTTGNAYEDDLARLIEDGERVVRRFKTNMHQSSGYELWYSEAKLLIKQVLPERLPDFVQYYEGSGARSASKQITTPADYTIRHAIQGVETRVASRDGITGIGPSAAVNSVQAQLDIVQAAKKRFEVACSI